MGQSDSHTHNSGGITNSSFENGNFTGWSTVGNTGIEAADFGSESSQGTYYATLSTQFDTVPDSDVESFLGLPYGSLNALGKGNIEEGSAIKTTFNAKAGDILTFDWNFMTNELDSTLVGGNEDFAILTLNSLPYNLPDTSSSFETSFTSFSHETGFQTVSIEIPTTGAYTLGLGVVNVDDPIFDSALAIDNIQLGSTYNPNSIFGQSSYVWSGFDTLGMG